MVKHVTPLLIGLLLWSCQISSTNQGTGGINVDAGSLIVDAGSIDGGASVSCPAGVAALLGDPNYQSSQVALTALDGSVLS